jgi:hypothetical protein
MFAFRKSVSMVTKITFIYLNMCSLISSKIHAYNLETNAWEEIATKPHEKIGKLKVWIHVFTILFYTCVLGGKGDFLKWYGT